MPYVLSQLLLTPASGLTEQPSHRLAPLRAVFSLLDRSPLSVNLCSEGKEREVLSLLFHLLLLVAGVEF